MKLDFKQPNTQQQENKVPDPAAFILLMDLSIYLTKAISFFFRKKCLITNKLPIITHIMSYKSSIKQWRSCKTNTLFSVQSGTIGAELSRAEGFLMSWFNASSFREKNNTGRTLAELVNNSPLFLHVLCELEAEAKNRNQTLLLLALLSLSFPVPSAVEFHCI